VPQRDKSNFSTPEFLEELKNALATARGRELPGFLNAGVFKNILGIYLNQWREPTIKCLTEICEICESVGEKLATQSILNYSKLLEHVVEIVIQLISDSRESTEQSLVIAVDREIDEPFTLNHYYMDTVNKLRQERFLKGLEEHLAPMADDDGLISLESPELAKNITQWFQEGIGDISNEDQEAQEMDIIMKSYWKVALKSFVDLVPKMIQQTLLDKISKEISEILFCYDKEQVSSYFDIPRVEKMKREELLSKQKRMKAALKKIQPLLLEKITYRMKQVKRG